MIPVITDLTQIPSHLVGGSVAVGNFDSVHLGHARLVRQLVDQAADLGGPAVVITFDPPPIALLKPNEPLLPPITTIARRAELLARLGVSGLIALQTNGELLSLSPKRFFDEVLVRQLRLTGMVEGPNFRFGKDRAGDTKLLASLCSDRGIDLKVVDAKNDDGGMISSSRIRRLLAEGDVAAANAMLTQPFQISGLVAPGAGRGQKMLVATANLTHVQSLIPAHGVYGGSVRVDDRLYRAAVHIGPNPTFGESEPKIELHLVEWHGELYGRSLNCELLIKVRDIRKFDSREALLQQIRSDIELISEKVTLNGE